MTRRAPLTSETPEREPSSHASGVRAVNRDRPSLREIFDEYAPFLWRTIRHLGVAERDVEDVAQEVFITVHRKLGGFEGRSSLRTWLYGIALRVAWDYRRRAVRREVPSAEPPHGVVEATQEQQLSQRDTQRALRALLDRLDDDKRAVFVLYELEELSMKDVAEAIGCPLQTAYSRLHAARRIVLEAGRDLRKQEDL